MQATDANEDYEKPLDERKYKTFKEYSDAKGSADTMATMGYGLAGVGAAALVWGVIRTATGGPASAWWIGPQLGPQGSGLVLSGSF
jgi:hypothetical protein